MFATRPYVALAANLLLVGSVYAEFPQVALLPINQHQIVSPVAIANAGDGSNRLFVVDQRGTIRVIQNGTLLPDPFLDISSRLVPERAGFDERGLLGLAFHPDFATVNAPGEGKFYVYYSAPQPNGDPGDPINPVDHQSIVAEYSVGMPGGNIANPNSERVLLAFDQPQFNHNGGQVAFGPDHMLYISTGDGGGGGDNEPGHTGGGPGNQPGSITGNLGNAQDRTKLLGKILRVDVQGNNAPNGQYGIPMDNPFVGVGNNVREEIFAYGLRNPWRFSFDDGPGGTNRLFAADVGQALVEEVNLITSGGNYGWRIMEGNLDFDPTVSPDPPVPLIGPVAEYSRPTGNVGLPEIGVSVTGGFVYRGSEFPELVGKYLFGDWSRGFQPPNGTLLGLEEVAPGDFELSILDVLGGNPIGSYILAFGEDESGEIYVATKQTLAASAVDPMTGLPSGAIYRLVVVPEPNFAALTVLVGILVGARRVFR